MASIIKKKDWKVGQHDFLAGSLIALTGELRGGHSPIILFPRQRAAPGSHRLEPHICSLDMSFQQHKELRFIPPN